VQAPYTGQWFLLGRQQPRMGNTSDWYAPYNAYPCGDGESVHVACYNDKFFRNLCAAIGRPELAEDGRFASPEARLAHAAELDEAIAAFLSTLPRSDALELLWEHDVIAGPVNGYEEVFADPQVVHNEMVVELDGRRLTGVPLRLSATPGSVRRPPPKLGQHTTEVLAELGIETEVVAR
jgi:crotonobetainyl-CoA:carnitine CoA-transferase CaiB-like acyl-CoA transferase